MKFPYIIELQKTMREWETDYWSEELQKGKSMEVLYPMMQIHYQQIEEAKSIQDVKKWCNPNGDLSEEMVGGVFHHVFLHTLTLSN